MLHTSGTICRTTAVLGLVMTLIPQVSAAWLGFRNQLSRPVVVQTVVEGKSGARQSIPHRLYPGETTWDWVADDTCRTVIVSDAKTVSKALTRCEVSVGRQDVLYIIQCESRTTQVKKAWEGSREQARKTGP